MVALFKSDPAFVGNTLAAMTSGASLVEFVLTPFLGAVSDKVCDSEPPATTLTTSVTFYPALSQLVLTLVQVGRRPVLLGAAALCAIARFVTFTAGDISLKAVVLANWFDR